MVRHRSTSVSRFVRMQKEIDSQNGARLSKVRLAVGAASLFLFVVGLKRTFRTEDGREVVEGSVREEAE